MKEIRAFPMGTVNAPPSKSFAHRAIICAALAGGERSANNTGASDDVLATKRCMEALLNGNELLDCGESGSTLRFLLPVAAALGREVRLTGRGLLLERPLGPYETLFGERGLIREGVYLHLTGRFNGGKCTLPGNISSQFISGVLLALPLAGGGEIEIIGPLESAPYVDMTIDVMARFGVTVGREGNYRFRVSPGERYLPADYTVEGDYSQAAFFLVAAALGCPVEVLGLNPASLQGDRVVLDILRNCGAEVFAGPGGGLTVRPGKLRGTVADVSDCPDLAPVLATLFCLCEGESRITGGGRLRLKESDRLSAMASELGKLGGKLKIEGDELRITGVPCFHGGRVESWNDHRVAMSLAVAAIRCDGTVELEGEGAVSKSYPDFWTDFEKGARPA